MTDSTGLCLQDLVGATNGTNSNQNSNSNQNNASDHLHHHHHNLHESVRHDSISVSSAISNLMPTTVGSIGSGLSHLHHSAHVDLNHHHHHITSPHTPSVLHEPLEKLKCKFDNYYILETTQKELSCANKLHEIITLLQSTFRTHIPLERAHA